VHILTKDGQNLFHDIMAGPGDLVPAIILSHAVPLQGGTGNLLLLLSLHLFFARVPRFLQKM